MAFTGVSTSDLCKAVAAELRNRGVDYTLLAIVDDEPCVHMPSKVRGDSDRLARGMFTLLRDYLNTIETEPGDTAQYNEPDNVAPLFAADIVTSYRQDRSVKQ